MPETDLLRFSVMRHPIAIVSPSRKSTVVSALRVLTVGGRAALPVPVALLTSGFTWSVIRRSAFTVGLTVNFTPAEMNWTALCDTPLETVVTVYGIWSATLILASWLFVVTICGVDRILTRPWVAKAAICADKR